MFSGIKRISRHEMAGSQRRHGGTDGVGAPSCTTDALAKLKQTAAAMHQDKENSRQSEQMWREKLTAAVEHAAELEAKLGAERAAVAGLRSTTAESMLSFIDSCMMFYQNKCNFVVVLQAQGNWSACKLV